jgi:hypothetical protein
MSKNPKHRPRSISSDTSALLLAEYRLRRGTKEDFFHSEAAQRIVSRDVKNDRDRVVWLTPSAIEQAWKRALRMEKSDPDFAERVRFLTWSVEAIGGTRNIG